MKTNTSRVWFIGVVSISIGVLLHGTARAQVTTAWTGIGNGKWEIDATGPVTANYTDLGGATSKPARYYRVKLVP